MLLAPVLEPQRLDVAYEHGLSAAEDQCGDAARGRLGRDVALELALEHDDVIVAPAVERVVAAGVRTVEQGVVAGAAIERVGAGAT